MIVVIDADEEAITMNQNETGIFGIFGDPESVNLLLLNGEGHVLTHQMANYTPPNHCR